MELDQSNGESPDQRLTSSWSTTISDHDQALSHVRSYRCSFCQRGFSNAQALGGHMNIHRKDRARLKEYFSADKTTLSLDQSPSQLRESSGERCSNITPKRPSTSPIEIDSDSVEADAKGDFFEDKLHLSLSIETSSSSNEKDELSNSRVSRRRVKRNMQFNHGAKQSTELDLELRLGPEPEPHQAATKG